MVIKYLLVEVLLASVGFAFAATYPIDSTGKKYERWYAGLVAWAISHLIYLAV